MKHRSIIILLLLSLLMPLGAFAADTAEQIMTKCAAKINGSPSITIKCTLDFGKEPAACEIVIAKDKYALTMKDMDVWFDGLTQWTYAPSTQQLSITEPTIDELMESNPFAILNHYAKTYTVKRLATRATEIELTAKSKFSNVRRAILTLNPTTYMPQKLKVTLSNGRTFTATVGSATIGKQLPASRFVYDKKKHPAKETVDLR